MPKSHLFNLQIQLQMLQFFVQTDPLLFFFFYLVRLGAADEKERLVVGFERADDAKRYARTVADIKDAAKPRPPSR